MNLGEKGISDGLETDSNGILYAGNVEQDSISMYNPATTYATIFVRDPRINWVSKFQTGGVVEVSNTMNRSIR